MIGRNSLQEAAEVSQLLLIELDAWILKCVATNPSCVFMNLIRSTYDCEMLQLCGTMYSAVQ